MPPLIRQFIPLGATVPRGRRREALLGPRRRDTLRAEGSLAQPQELARLGAVDGVHRAGGCGAGGGGGGAAGQGAARGGDTLVELELVDVLAEGGEL